MLSHCMADVHEKVFWKCYHELSSPHRASSDARYLQARINGLFVQIVLRISIELHRHHKLKAFYKKAIVLYNYMIDEISRILKSNVPRTNDIRDASFFSLGARDPSAGSAQGFKWKEVEKKVAVKGTVMEKAESSTRFATEEASIYS